MRRNSGLASFSCSCALLIALFALPGARAQNLEWRHTRQAVTQPVDDNKRVTLHGNTRPEASLENDRGRVDDDFRLDHMMLQLKRSPESERALEQFLADLQNPGSPNFHHWISAKEFGARFGVAPQDIAKVTDWLERYHLKVNTVYPNGMVIDFSGTAEQVRRAFGVEIHKFDLRGEHHFANTHDPGIPAALAPVVAGIVSIHNFSPHALHNMRVPSANFTFSGSFGQTFALVPADLATIYNLNPLFAAGYTGQGQTIVLIEDTDVFSAADWNAFRSTLGLSSYTSASFTSVHPAPANGPNNCGAPGVIAPNDAEAILDAEWASAAAPGAAIEMAACADSSTTFGGLIAMQNLLNAQNPPPALMSISYGQCETVNGAAANAAYNSAYQLAVAEGVSVFVAAGDSGAAGCDNSVTAATHGIGVNAFASTPYNVAVGGTDFSDTLNGANGTYWGDTNTSSFGSALSYIPEIPWNDSCAGALLSQYEGFQPYGPNGLCNDGFLGSLLQTTVAGGGGPSGCATGTPSNGSVVSGTCQGWPKPAWQSVLGNPSDGVRDTPDVSLFAADGLWSHYYVFCWSDTANGGAACNGSPSGWSGAGGTSFASPIMAGIQALVNQRTGSRQGNPNPAYYQLASAEYGASGNLSCNATNGNTISGTCVFNDVTQGDMAVNCTGHANCFHDGAPAGVLSTSNSSYQPAYGTATGWDFATGIGSVNAFNLVNNWPGSTSIPTFALSASPNSVTLTQGTSGTSTISVLPQNGFTGSVSLSASGLPSGVTASFNPTSTSGTSTLTLQVSSTATTGTTNVTITGTSGSLTAFTSVSLTVNPVPVPNFALSASPSSLTIVQGATGKSTITVTPQNGFNSSVSLSASGLPTGVTASFSPGSTASTSTLTLAASSTATTGKVTVTITGTSGSLSNITPLSLTVTLAPPVSILPQGWTDADIGNPGAAGSGNYANNVFTIKGAGSQIYGNSDTFNFVYQPLTGDGSISARLVNFQGSGYATAGVMIRNTLDANSANAKTADWPGFAGIYFDLRTTAGGSTSEPGSISASAPYWVKVSRTGNSLSSFVSTDGVNWTSLGSSQTINMGSTVYIGMAVNSANNSSLATATFDNVSVTSAGAPVITSLSTTSGPVGSQVVINGSNFGDTQGNSAVFLNGLLAAANIWTATTINITVPASATTGPLVVSVAPSMNDSNPMTFNVTAQPLPAPWLDQDVGATGVAGNASFANGTFTVNGAGAGIFGSADAFHFVYQPLSGDGTIVARLVSLQGGAGYVSAGVMIRNTLDAGSVNAKVSDWRSYGGFYFDIRTVAGGSTTEPGNLAANAPYWVKVTRSGNTFSGYVSADGANWVQLGANQSLNMNQNVLVGLAVTSGSTTALATGTFDNVSVTTPAPLPPSFTLSASPSSVTLVQGTSGTSTISVGPQNSFNRIVSFSASGLPAGVTASFSPASSTTGSVLTLTANGSATTGPAAVTITGTSGTLTASTTLSLTVNPAPTFTLTASPNNLTVVQGTSGTSSIIVSPQNGFSASVSFSASGLPAGVTASFSPASSTTGSTLTLTASSNAAPGPATVTVTGSSGTLTASTALSLTVNPAPSFSLSASPISVTVVQGASGTTTINVTPQNAFSGSVTFSASGLPTGVTASFNPASSATASTLTLTASGTATTGTVSFTITGTSGSLTASTSLSLTVNPAPTFSLSASPNSMTVIQGASGTSTISVTPQNGFNNSVSLSASGLPNGVTASFSPASTPTTSTLTLTASGTAATGSTTITISGASGSLTGSTTLSLTVNAAAIPSFTLSASPNSLTFPQGANGTSTITVTPQNGFSGSVTFAASGLPSGVTASFNPASNTSSTTLMLSANTTAATGTVTVTVSGTSGSLTGSATLSLTITQAAPSNGLPVGWNDVDVGVPGVAGTATFANNAFTVNGAGAQIFGPSDAFNFVYQTLGGDGTIVARLVSIQGGTTNASAGVMIRDTLDAGSANAKIAEWPAFKGFFFDVRATAGGNTAEPGSANVVAPYWIKVTRAGNAFSAFVALDGVNWVQVGSSQTATMGANVNIGLAVTSGSTSALATAVFDNVSVTSAATAAPSISSVSATTGPIGSQVAIGGSSFGAVQGNSVVLLNGMPTSVSNWSNFSITITIPSGATSGPLVVSVAPGMNDSNAVTFTVTAQPLPAGWLDQDVGSTGVLGSATSSSGVFTVNGAGAQVFGNTDAFHFVYQPLTGDGTVIARLVSLQGGSTNVSAGVMVRNSLGAAAANAKTANWRSFNGLFFDVRATDGGSTAEPGSLTAAAPYWVKVSRSGNTVSGFASVDGVNWVQLGGSQTVTMGQTVYVGLGVTSGSTGAVATATFDNVSVTNP